MQLNFNQTQHESLPNATQAQEIPDGELDSEDLTLLLVSLRFFKARYVHMVDQQSFFYEALRLIGCKQKIIKSKFSALMP